MTCPIPALLRFQRPSLNFSLRPTILRIAAAITILSHAAQLAPSTALAQVDYPSQIQPIFNASCVSCHGGTSGVYLDSHAATMASTGSRYGTKIVVPGNAAASPLYDKLLPDPEKGSRMPQGGRLTDAQIALIRDWINQGATEVATSLESPQAPSGFDLAQNVPNPFNPTTRITFTLPAAAPVRIEVWSIAGRRLAVLSQGVQPAGTHTFTLDADAIATASGALASGTYLYRMVTPGFTRTRALTLVR